MPPRPTSNDSPAPSGSGASDAPRVRKRARSAELSRERILDAALHEFATKGYDGATTAAIARRVGVTQPLIHYHFGSKIALWRACSDLSFQRMADELAAAERELQADNLPDAVRVLARRFVGYLATNRDFLRLMFTEPAHDTPRMAWVVEHHVRPIAERARGVLVMAQEAGLLKKHISTERLLFAFLGAASFFFDAGPLVQRLYALDPTNDEEVERFVDTLIDIFTTGIAVRRKAGS